MITMRRMASTAAALTLAVGMTACGGEKKAATESAPEPEVTTAASASASASPSASASSSSSGAFASGSTMAELKAAGKITIGTKFDQPLFGLKGLSGDPEGFDVEIAKLIVAALGLDEDDITWKETPSAVRETAIEKGDVDLVVATYTINDTRKEKISFAGPYYEAGQDLMVREDNDKVTGPDSLKDSTDKVCSVKGSTPAEKIKEYVPDSRITLFDVYSKCADALKNNQVDVVTTDNVILIGLVDTSDGKFKLVGKPFTKEPYGIGIDKGDKEFCEFIHDTLEKAAADGSYEKAWKETAGEVADEVPSLPTLGTCS